MTATPDALDRATIAETTAREVREAETAALVALAEHGVAPDTQEALVHGNPLRDVPPDALKAALLAAAPYLASRLVAEARREEGERAAKLTEDGYRCRTCGVIFTTDVGHPDPECGYPNWDRLNQEEAATAIRLPDAPERDGERA